ncbi:hypothetical protein IC582_005606 [Cucumis melo]
MGDSMVHFGIIGAAKIAQKISRAIALTPNATLLAVGSRSIEKALKFASNNGLSSEVKIYGSYEAVLDDPDIDVIYIPLPTSLHLRWAVLAAEKKKHVLLEKPAALNVVELDMILEACKANEVQFMDGTMWMHNPRTAKMKEFLCDAKMFGQLKSVHSIYTFGVESNFLESDIRTKPDLDGFGALGDIGWYCIRSILFAADFNLPKKVIAFPNPVLNESGVILSCGCSLFWDDGKLATFYCSFLENMTQNMTVIGTNGTLHLTDFVIPYTEKEVCFSTNSKYESTSSEPLPNNHTIPTDLPQEVHMVMEFSRLVKQIKENGSEPDEKWPAMSRKTQLVLDAVKASLDQGSEVVEVGTV